MVVDPFSAPYLKGATVDFVETLQESGFKVDNPNASGSCGCGHSFQVAEDGDPDAGGHGPRLQPLTPPGLSDSRADGSPLRVAVVGSGPAGFYAAGRAAGGRPAIEVDLIERLPTPWGLVRLGVAPDHPKHQSRLARLREDRRQPGFRFFGNVEVGTDVTHAELAQLYDAVVYTVGAQTDRRLGIPGEDLPGSWAATEFVAWYNGHPDYQQLALRPLRRARGRDRERQRRGRRRADARAHPEELAPTDTADAAIEAIVGSGLREIVMLGRRGPAQAAFTPPELKELGELAGADVVVDPADLELDPASEAALEDDRATARRNVDLLREYAAREPDGKPQRLVASLPRLAGRDPRRGAGRGGRGRPQRARRGRTGGSAPSRPTSSR